MRCSTTGRSTGPSSQKGPKTDSAASRKSTPPIMFLAPGLSPRSSTATLIPARAMVRAAADPAGPAPITIASNFSSSNECLSRSPSGQTEDGPHGVDRLSGVIEEAGRNDAQPDSTGKGGADCPLGTSRNDSAALFRPLRLHEHHDDHPQVVVDRYQTGKHADD